MMYMKFIYCRAIFMCVVCICIYGWMDVCVYRYGKYNYMGLYIYSNFHFLPARDNVYDAINLMYICYGFMIVEMRRFKSG